MRGSGRSRCGFRHEILQPPLEFRRGLSVRGADVALFPGIGLEIIKFLPGSINELEFRRAQAEQWGPSVLDTGSH